MPSPAKRYTQRSPASSSSSSRRGAGGSPSALESVNAKNTENNNQGGDTTESESIAVAARRRLLNNSNDNDNNNYNEPSQMTHIQMVGKRTGVTLPPRGEIPLDEDGLEDADAFFAAAKSPAPPTTTTTTSNNNKIRERDRRDEERRKRHEALEEEGRKNALKRPDILNNEADTNDSGSDEDGGEGGGNSNSKYIDKYQPTPKQPNWSNRLLHQAMGIDVTNMNEDGEQQQHSAPEYSPQYTVLSKVSTAAPSTQGSLETIATESRHALRGKLNSVQLDQLAVNVANSAGAGGITNIGNKEEEEGEEQEAEFDGPMDPPEEVSEWADHPLTGENKKGMDPEERDVYLEPETQQDDDDDADGDKGEGSVSGVNAKQSAKSAASSGAGSSTNLLETSLEEVVDNFDNDDNEGMEGGMQFATQEDDFGGGGGGGFDDDDGDNDGFHNDGVDDDAMNNDVASAAAASQQSRKSNSSSQVSTKSGKTSLLSDEDDEEEVPQKKKGKKDKKAPPITPTSVLRTKKTSKKKKQTNNSRHVNWSTPNGVSTGIPLANRDFESIPVTDFKESYPAGEEPKTPGGSRSLRRSRRAKFQPLKFWKNEKLIYEAQNEKGLLGEAMGDMPVVAGVMHALPTPYKEVKRKEPESKKKAAAAGKKKRGRDSDDDSDGGESSKRAKSPFDDKTLRKKFRIHNGESGSVWSETLESATDIKIVSRLDNRSFSKLPLSSTRKKRESKVVGFASQAFHVPTDDDDLFPGYIAGNVVLPPRGIKDAEGVGLCSQVFNVGDCQPNSVEFALADPSGQDGEFDPKSAQRFLLSKGDMFQIPPGNVYRIENHSKTEKANLFWTIIKCTSRAEQEDSEEEEED